MQAWRSACGGRAGAWGEHRKLGSFVERGLNASCVLDVVEFSARRFGDAAQARQIFGLNRKADNMHGHTGECFANFEGGFTGVLLAIIRAVGHDKNTGRPRCPNSFGCLPQGFDDWAFASGIKFVDGGDDRITVCCWQRDDFGVAAITLSAVAERGNANFGLPRALDDRF